MEKEEMDNFLQDEFNARFGAIFFPISIFIGILVSYWIFYGNTFNDGVYRFFIGNIFILHGIFLAKKICFNKFKKKYKVTSTAKHTKE